jgi:hypothetical protein
MSIIAPLLAYLCVATVFGRPRLPPPEMPLARDGFIPFDGLPGLILLQEHDRRLRMELALPVGRTMHQAVAGRGDPRGAA